MAPHLPKHIQQEYLPIARSFHSCVRRYQESQRHLPLHTLVVSYTILFPFVQQRRVTSHSTRSRPSSPSTTYRICTHSSQTTRQEAQTRPPNRADLRRDRLFTVSPRHTSTLRIYIMKEATPSLRMMRCVVLIFSRLINITHA